jgi:16S rRNA (cytosine967-C5)-methyltransferase
VNAREVALQVVRDVFAPPDAKAPRCGAQESLEYRARKAALNDRDRAFATELAYGAIKMRRTLEWYLQPFIGERAQPVPPAIREVLLLALYELIYTRADAHATVFEFVNLAKKYGHRGLGNLVNAVLRSSLRAEPSAPVRGLFVSDEEYFGTRYSLPTWLVRQWQATFGERTESICAAVNEPARSAVSVNLARGSREQLAQRLAAQGVTTEPSAFAADSLLADSGGALLARLERSAGGDWWIQSESSAMAVEVLNPQPGERILDVCSGRGNKALQLLGRMHAEGSLLCIELDARKTALLRQRIEQAGFSAVCVTGDATRELLQPQERFDRVLVDAPCSGIGIVGRHPEARWKKQGTDGERLALTQRTLLERSARHVNAGGALVYAVCSTDPRETSEVIDWFVIRENFERGLVPAALRPFLTEAGDVLIPPGLGGRDGFFIARLERRL